MWPGGTTEGEERKRRSNRVRCGKIKETASRASSSSLSLFRLAVHARGAEVAGCRAGRRNPAAAEHRVAKRNEDGRRENRNGNSVVGCTFA